jgi:hypothetical protein
MQIKLLHLLHPNTSFSDYIVDYFETLNPRNNKYVVIKEGTGVLDFSLTKYGSFIKVIGEDKFFENIGKWTDYKAVVSYAMSPLRARLINDIPKSVKVGWVLFGYEFYENLPEIKHKIYLEETKSFLRKGIKIKLVNTVFYKKLCKLIGKRHIANELEIGFKRVDVFGVLIRQEMALIKQTLDLKFFSWKPFIIHNIKDFLGNIDVEAKCSGQNILLGNSSSITNNHLDALHFLSKQSLGDRKVITPLSYGHMEYGEKIVQYGNTLLGDNFKPLTSFLAKEDYNVVLLSCSVAIMNHLRQQAFGNIVALLWFGTKVFLNESNPVYLYFKEMNVKVFSIQKDLETNFEEALVPLSDEAISHNRTILSKIFSKEAVLEKNRQFLEALIQ